MSSFDDIRRWFGHYGVGGAGQTAWDLDDIKLRRLSQIPTGSHSLGDLRPGSGKYTRRIASAQRHDLGTSNAFKVPSKLFIELMDSPGSPLYVEQDESYAFGDPWGKEYFARAVSIPGGTAIGRGVFANCYFYYNLNRTLRLKADYVARPQTNAYNEGGASFVVVEYASGYGSGASKVLHSFTQKVNDRNIKSINQTFTCDSSKPYKLVSMQIVSPRDIATNLTSSFSIANMFVEEAG